MKLRVNGKPEEQPEGASVAQLIESHNLTDKPCAVEMNGSIVRAADHKQTTLNEGDEIEIVTLVGGG